MHKNAQKWSENLRPKFAATTPGCTKILISTHARVKTSHIAMLVARKPSCCDARAFLTGLKVI